VATREEIQSAVKIRYERMKAEIDRSHEHPGEWLRHTKAVDARTGEVFQFGFDNGWEWQYAELTAFRDERISLRLKARQLGISWLAIGYGLWKVLATPGTRAICVSINETEAGKLINRAWDLWENTPEHLRFGAKVIKPSKGRPTERIEWVFPDGKISSLVAMPSTPRAGHGEVATLVILDEFARHQYAEEGWKAFIPVVADGGQIIIVSTANGIGGIFYDLWMNAEERGVTASFLPWTNHPRRDEAWYDRVARALSEHDRAEQYPLTPADAFMGTAGCWFDTEALAEYAASAPEPKYRFQWATDETGAKATLTKRKDGWIKLWHPPEENHEYAIAVDAATGRGEDYTCFYVIDLTEMKLCAEFHSRIDSDIAAEQIHFTGRMFHTARVAVEQGGGYGDAIVVALRDGRKGRPAYPKLYRHVAGDRPDWKPAAAYGFPISSKTRPLIINQAEQAIREKVLPFMPMDLVLECKTFVKRPVNPSPAASNGCHDDRVMAFCIALEMYRQYGAHPNDARKRRKKRKYRPSYAWE
jgi:hypothetical protein